MQLLQFEFNASTFNPFRLAKISANQCSPFVPFQPSSFAPFSLFAPVQTQLFFCPSNPSRLRAFVVQFSSAVYAIFAAMFLPKPILDECVGETLTKKSSNVTTYATDPIRLVCISVELSLACTQWPPEMSKTRNTPITNESPSQICLPADSIINFLLSALNPRRRSLCGP